MPHPQLRAAPASLAQQASLAKHALGLVLAAFMVAPQLGFAQTPAQRLEWNQPIEPFNIIGNIYFVGVRGVTAFLITDPNGHILIDGGLPESAPLIASSIRKLGFNPANVKFLLINHAHMDHAGGLAELKRITGAKLIASKGDEADLESGQVIGRPESPPFPPVKVDRIIADGAKVRVGQSLLTAHLTPGHTRGCTSWSLRRREMNVLFACSLTVAGQNLIDDPTFPTAAVDFRTTFEKLSALKADVFLTFHPEFFSFEAKRARRLAGDRNAFRDPLELGQQIGRAQAAFEKTLAEQQAQKRR